MSKNHVPKETAAAMRWLSGQPGVTSVVLGKRPTRIKHHHALGFTRVSHVDDKGVHLRTYSEKLHNDVFVYAPPSTFRDRWVAALVSGQVIGNGSGPTFKEATPPKPVVGEQHSFSSHVPAPQAINDHAGQTFDVTPELAAKWLERNTRNRDLRQDIVEKYSADMKAGRWEISPDAIAFDTNGAIVNGQHRLWAVLECGKTVRMLVVFNLKPEVVRVLDDHLKRGLIDVLHIARPGVNIQTKHAAIARMMMYPMVQTDRRHLMAKTSRQTQMAFLERHLTAIDFTVRDCFKSTSKAGLTHAAILTPVTRAYYTRDHQRLVAFAKVLMTGMPEGQGDKAAILLRNWTTRLGRQGMRAASDSIYRKAERAVDAFLKGEAISTLYEATEELFPLPEEQAPKRAKKS